jgi:hypothetical protein
VKVVRWLAFPAAAAICVAAAGCGSGGSSSEPSPAQLTKEVQSAVNNAKSVHISGTATQQGKALGLNLSFTRANEVSGTVSLGGAGFAVLSTQGSTYIRVTAAFLQAENLPASACSEICGKWLKTSAAQSQSLTGDLSMKSLLGGINNGSPKFKEAGSTTINGQPAWILKATDGSGSTAYVASSGTHYLLRITEPSQHGRLDFTQWNSATIPGPPPASQVVDLSKLGGLG